MKRIDHMTHFWLLSEVKERKPAEQKFTYNGIVELILCNKKVRIVRSYIAIGFSILVKDFN